MNQSNIQSELSAEASIFVPIAQREKKKDSKEFTSLAPSWIIREHHQYQISERSIISAMKDESWGIQNYVWFDASLVRCLSLADQEGSSAYILSQREFYDEKKIVFNRQESDMHRIGVLSGYLREDKGEVSVHESGMFSIPYYFKGLLGNLLQIGGVVPQNKLMTTHKSPGNQIKAHNDQDLLFLSYIDAREFKSIAVATKLAAHQLYMMQRGVYGYSRPKWNITTVKRQHYATLHYEASFEDLINAMKTVLTNSDGKYNKVRYNQIIFDCTVRPKFDHFDGNEVARWRNDQYYNLHAHKFPLDLVKLEKYETLAYLNHQRNLGVNIVDKKTFSNLANNPSLYSMLVLGTVKEETPNFQERRTPTNLMDYIKVTKTKKKHKARC